MINENSKQYLSESDHHCEDFFEEKHEAIFEEIEHLQMQIVLDGEKERGIEAKLFPDMGLLRHRRKKNQVCPLD